MDEMTTERFTLWAILHDPVNGRAGRTMNGFRRRVMAELATFDTYEEALAAWTRADARRPARSKVRQTKDLGPSEFRRYERDRYVAGPTLELDYLAVRSTNDREFARRYPQVAAGRLTALLAHEGGRVQVRIYGNDYAGTVVRESRLSADVMFTAAGGPRVRRFPILPESPFDRGVQYAKA